MQGVYPLRLFRNCGNPACLCFPEKQTVSCSTLGPPLSQVPIFSSHEVENMTCLNLARNALSKVDKLDFDRKIWKSLEIVDLRLNPNLDCSSLHNVPKDILVLSDCPELSSEVDEDIFEQHKGRPYEHIQDQKTSGARHKYVTQPPLGYDESVIDYEESPIDYENDPTEYEESPDSFERENAFDYGDQQYDETPLHTSTKTKTHQENKTVLNLLLSKVRELNDHEKSTERQGAKKQEGEITVGNGCREQEKETKRNLVIGFQGVLKIKIT